MLDKALFHNLTMLSAGVDKTDAASLGLCYDRNVWLARVLECLGFSVRIIGARTRFFMERKEGKLLLCRALQMPFDHICLMVHVGHCNSAEFLVDVGNGSPYFSLLQLSTMLETNKLFRAKHCNTDYRIVQNGSGTFDLEHLKFLERKDWRVNCTFRLSDSLTPEDIETIIRAHGTDPHFGHFLLGLRINRWSENGSSVIVRDTEAWTLGPDGVKKSRVVLKSGRELDTFVRKHFRDTNVPKLLIHAAPIFYKYITLMKPAIPLNAC
jgi:arylamine N-acetyltransferase